MTLEDQIEQLNNESGLPGVLTFAVERGLVCAQVTLPHCRATIFLQGAHLASWQPTDDSEVFFLSERSDFAAGKAIRGGIPVCFPWFGADAEMRDGGKPGPAHGFARVEEWEFGMAALIPGTADDQEYQLHLTFTLAPSEVSRRFGFDHFRVAYEMVFGRARGRELQLKFSVVNTGEAPLRYEEALHSYFAVKDVRHVELKGLGGAEFLDKMDGLKRKQMPAGGFTPEGPTDRVFPGNEAALELVDAGLERRLMLDKQGSATTVVWNPWAQGAATMKDLDAAAWPGFLCVEAANTGTDAITLASREARTLGLTVSVKGVGR